MFSSFESSQSPIIDTLTPDVHNILSLSKSPFDVSLTAPSSFTNIFKKQDLEQLSDTFKNKNYEDNFDNTLAKKQKGWNKSHLQLDSLTGLSSGVGSGGLKGSTKGGGTGGTTQAADLVINRLNPSKTNLLGSETISVSVTTANQGGANAATSANRFFLSKDAVLDTSDTALTTVNVPKINAGASNTSSVTLNLTSNLFNAGSGTYHIIAQADSGNAIAESNETNNVNAIAITYAATISDWCNQNLLDTELRSLASTLTTDNFLSRQDMIDLFKNAADGSIVDSVELNDLQTLTNNGRSLFGMQDHVYKLSDYIANGNAANTTSGIGNLAAGSTDSQMNALVNKWFYGSDRPQTSYTYQYAQGSLFQKGVSVNDIKQGAVGDCYYLATLSSIAQEKPSYIQSMFIDNGDNTFTVKFLRNGVNEYVTVDRFLPTNSSGNLVYASSGSNYTNTNNELWVALAEKAYAQLAESGWSRPAYNATTSTNSYAAIESGWMDRVIQQITGLATTSITLSTTTTAMTQASLINLVNSNQILTAGFVYGDGGGLVVNSHAYTITSYNSSTNTFYLRNPWGYRDSQLTWDQLVGLQAVIQYSIT